MPTRLEKISISIMEGICNDKWGFDPLLMQDIVAQHGAIKPLFWLARNMPKYEKTLREWGPIRTHIVGGAISTINSCPYCVHGHMYSFQLHYLDIYKKTFPVNEKAMTDFCYLEDIDVIASAWRETLLVGGLEEEVPFVERAVALIKGAKPTKDKTDRITVHLIKMFEFLNACGVNGNTPPDEAHDPINKDMALKARYAQMRKEEASAKPRPKSKEEVVVDVPLVELESRVEEAQGSVGEEAVR